MRKPQGLPPNAMLEQIQATHERLFFPMGESLLFQTNSMSLLRAADDAFGNFPTRSSDGQTPLVLRFFVHDEQHEPGQVSSGQRPHPVYRTQQHLFYISAGPHSTAVADLEQGYAFGFFAPSVARDLAFVRYVFIQGVAFALLSTARHFMAVHAACVVKDGTSVILQGHAGAGKSTMAFACARRGYQVLAEDGLLIRSRAEGMRLWGAPWKLHLLPESTDFFPELRHERPTLQINGEWKLEVDLEGVIPGSTITDADPGVVFFLDRGTTLGATRVVRVPAHQVLREFQIVWPWTVGWTALMERQLSQLLSQRTYRLFVNGSPDEAVDALDTVLAELDLSKPSNSESC